MRQTTEAAEQTFACTINQNDAITFSNFYICIYFKRNSAIWKSVVKIVKTTCQQQQQHPQRQADRQTQTVLEQRHVHVDMCDCDCRLLNTLTQLSAVAVVLIVVVDVTLYESICYNASMSLARQKAETITKASTAEVFSHFPILSKLLLALFPLPHWQSLYSNHGRGLRKVVKLQLRHFWLLRPHKSKQKCRLAIESEKREFCGTELTQTGPANPDPGANLNLTEREKERELHRWNCECQDSGFRISGSKLTIIAVKDEKNALGHYNFRTEGRCCCNHSELFNSLPLPFFS